ncbi:MAG: PAS domain S-box protein [Cyclobacteriaceae bacterium]
MIQPLKSSTDPLRLKALSDYHILDTLPESGFDNITQIAVELTQIPNGGISFFTDSCEWFKSQKGIHLENIPLKSSICATALLGQDALVEVQDTYADPQYAQNEYVQNDPRIRFFICVPIMDSFGHVIGALSLFDVKANSLSESQKSTLNALASQVSVLLELRKQTQLSEHKDHDLNALLENLGDGVFEVDENGICTYANSEMCEFLNRPQDEIIGNLVWDMIDPADVPAMKAYYIQQFKNKSLECSYTYRLLPLGRAPLYVEQRSTMRYEGNTMVKLRSIARDITENIELKKELEKNEQLFKLVSENSSDIITVHDPTGECIFISAACESLLGYPQEQCIGKNPSDFIHPEDFKKLDLKTNFSDIRELYESQVQKVEYRFRKADGSFMWLETFIKPVIDDSGKLVSLQASSRDVTFRRAEREQLIVAKNKAEEASKAKNSFLSMMSHEIRTPLNGIIGTTNLLIKKDPKEKQLPLLNILKQSGDNLLAILNDILDINKIEENKIEFDFHEFNFQELVWLIRDNYESQANDKGLSLNCSYDQNLSKKYIGDSVRISQVLHNLISNAVKFTTTGEVSICLSKINQHDIFDEILVEVIDTGIGIIKERQSDIFDTFVQAEKDTTRRFGGSGLGLAITKKLLALMNSQILLESKVDEGSNFSFRLALQRISSDNNEETNADMSNKFMPLSGKVLVVEDNQFNRLIACDFLEAWGCEVLEAEDGMEGLKLIEEKTADLVLLDLQMPVMDGYEVIRKLREYPAAYFQELPVIALTATVLSGTEEELYKLGINDFISKPFIPNELYNKVASKLPTKEIDKEEQVIKSIIINKLRDTFGQNSEKIERYLDIFKDTLTEEIEPLTLSIENSNFQHIRSHAHKIKSSLKMVGLHKMSLEANELEMMIDKGNPDAMIMEKSKNHLNNLKELLNQL